MLIELLSEKCKIWFTRTRILSNNCFIELLKENYYSAQNSCFARYNNFPSTIIYITLHIKVNLLNIKVNLISINTHCIIIALNLIFSYKNFSL